MNEWTLGGGFLAGIVLACCGWWLFFLGHSKKVAAQIRSLAEQHSVERAILLKAEVHLRHALKESNRRGEADLLGRRDARRQRLEIDNLRRRIAGADRRHADTMRQVRQLRAQLTNTEQRAMRFERACARLELDKATGGEKA